MKKGSKNVHVHNAVKHGYEAKVISESLKRAGNNPQLKGIIHEGQDAQPFDGQSTARGACRSS